VVRPRSKTVRPPRLKRAMKAYLRALQQRRFIRAAIAHVAKLRRDQPDQEGYLSRALPRWLRQAALDGVEPPEPDMWSFYWRGRGQKNRGAATPPA
jgi:hypothetical protein